MRIAPSPCERKGHEVKQQQRLEYMLDFLLNEDPKYRNVGMPSDNDEKLRFLRSLLNVRPPNPIDPAFLAIQDAYLQEEEKTLIVTDGALLPAAPCNPLLSLWQGDITTLKVDAIVNAANSAMLGCFVPCHGCIDNIIHTRAGVQLRLACEELMEQQGHDEPTGSAKITEAYNLPSKYVLHTVGPIASSLLTKRHEAQLASCYRSCLALAMEHSLTSIAFCCISTGEFHFPQERAAAIAVQTVADYLQQHAVQIKVIFNVFKKSDYDIYSRLLMPNK